MTSLYLIAIFLFPVCSQDQEVPYLDEKYYSYELDYSFQKKPTISANEVDLTGGQRRSDATPLPYVKIRVSLKDLDNDLIRYRVVNNFGKVMSSKKIKSSPVSLEIDMGFGEDIKDRTGHYIFTLTLINKNKQVQNKVVFAFEENGNLLINEVLRGKI